MGRDWKNRSIKSDFPAEVLDISADYEDGRLPVPGGPVNRKPVGVSRFLSSSSAPNTLTSALSFCLDDILDALSLVLASFCQMGGSA